MSSSGHLIPKDGPTVTILHFNDVYNVDPKTSEPSGGAARLKTAIDSMRTDSTMVLFSVSTFTKGEQMVPVLNECSVDCAVLGNHDFDYGIEQLSRIIKRTHFPWLLSNALDANDGQPLAGASLYHVIHRGGKKFGLIGLVEEEWLCILSTIERDEIKFQDYVTVGQKIAKFLKEKEKVDYVIALTHMRWPNDIRLAKKVPEIDLILGGHDHVTEAVKVAGKFIVKSGTDFKTFSKIELSFHQDQSIQINIEPIQVASHFGEDGNLKNQLKAYQDMINPKMDLILGYFNCDLDGRFSALRTGETNLGNFLADIMVTSTRADLAILHSGTIRSDEIHRKGPFRLRDLINILPTPGSMVVLSASGKTVWKALENGVSAWPRLEGRFPQVSGVTFAFDPSQPPGHRVDPRFIKIGKNYLSLEQKYRLVTKVYLYQGKDGYDCLKNCQVLVSEDECPEMITAVQNHFLLTKSYSRKNGLTVSLSNQLAECFAENRRKSNSSLKLDSESKLIEEGIIDSDDDHLDSGRSFEPRIENRIRIITYKQISMEIERQIETNGNQVIL